VHSDDLEDSKRHGVQQEGAIIPSGDHLQDPDADQDLAPSTEDEAETHCKCNDQPLIASNAHWEAVLPMLDVFGLFCLVEL